MVKKLLTLAFGLALAFNAMAQTENPVVPQSEIRFWTGTGSNRAVVSVTWNNTDGGNIAMVWGVQWNGNNISVADLMDTIDAYDNNLTIEHGTTAFTIINNITYSNSYTSFTGTAGWWWYNWKDANGAAKSSNGATADIVSNGDFIDWLPMDPSDYSSQPADYMIMAEDPNNEVPDEATIDASQIVYWVGEGSNQTVMAVNWADTALAWGYRWNGTKSVGDMLNAIAADDPRFSVEIGSYGLDDIIFVVAPGDTLRKQANSYWSSKNNGIVDAGMGQALNNGDFEKWAEPAAGVKAGSTYWVGYSFWDYSYIYPMAIHPVSTPQTEGIATAEGINLSVYPNPASNYVTLSGIENASVATLYDMRGTAVATYQLNGTDTRLDLSDLANGVYMLRVAESTVKIIVRH